MAEKAKKTTKTTAEPVGMDAARVNGTYGPTQETTATVATQATGDEPGTTTPNRGLPYEPTSTPVKNEGVSEQSAHARMQGVNNGTPAVTENGAVKNATNTTANTPAATATAGTVAPVTGTPAANTAGTVATGQPSGTGQPKTEVETSGTVAKGVPTNGTGYTVTESDLLNAENEAPVLTDEQKKLQEELKAQQEAIRNAQNQSGPQVKASDITERPKNPDEEYDKLSDEKQAKQSAAVASIKDYGADWTKGFTLDALRGSKLSIAEAMKNYEEYRKTHPEAPELNMYDFYALRNYDADKSLKKNEDDEKKAKNDEMWEDIQNALFSFADLYHGAKWAPDVEGKETTRQLTKRQEERRDRVKAMRDKDWQALQAMWKQQRANEYNDRKLKNAEAKQQAEQDYKRQMMDIKVKEAQGKGDLQAMQTQLAEAKLEAQRAKTEADRKLWDLKAQQIEANIRYTNERSRGGRSGSGKPTYETDTSTTTSTDYKTGKKTVTKEEHKYIAGSRANNKNTPPSKIKTPPSRRK